MAAAPRKKKSERAPSHRRKARTLNIAVQLAFVVKVLETAQQLAQNDGNENLLKRTGLHQIEARAARKVLHHNPDLRVFQVRAIVLGHEWRVDARQHGNLLLNVFNFIFGRLKINDLDGDGHVAHLFNAANGARTAMSATEHREARAASAAPLEHLAERALANTVKLDIEVFGVHIFRRQRRPRDVRLVCVGNTIMREKSVQALKNGQRLRVPFFQSCRRHTLNLMLACTQKSARTRDNLADCCQSRTQRSLHTHTGPPANVHRRRFTAGCHARGSQASNSCSTTSKWTDQRANHHQLSLARLNTSTRHTLARARAVGAMGRLLASSERRKREREAR